MDKETLKEIIKKEGDYKEFTYRDMICVIRRNGTSHLCGYVGVTPGYINPDGDVIYGKGYDDLYHIECHGGLTFADEFIDREDDLWFIGFDCGHAGDLSPYMLMDDRFGFSGASGTYRDMQYVETELKSMVDYIKSNYSNRVEKIDKVLKN